jgi:peptidoglycan/LPS O-acetylase OafA/YrhL
LGTIRTILAICVVVFHSYTILGAKFTGGRVAVESFFMISGFYMALILTEKYSGPNYSWKRFISSRLFRILPLYLLVLFLSFTVSLLGFYFWENPYYLGWYVPYWEKMNFFSRFYLIFENIILVGQDSLFFLKLNLQSGKLGFTGDMHLNRPLLNGFTFIPQAWTLSLEICFYLVAPFVLRLRWYFLLLIVLASLGLRWYLYNNLHLDWDPWTYRFFPTELAFFVSGGLLYRYYTLIKNKAGLRAVGITAMTLLIAAIILYNETETRTNYYSDFHRNEKHWYFYILFALCLPFIFQITRNSRADRFIGELSFPIYLIHHLIMMILKPYFFGHPWNMGWFGISTVLLSTAASLLLWFFFLKPLEKMRARKFGFSAA